MLHVPALRAEPFTPDSSDGERIRYVTHLWKSQDAALRYRDRQVEENIRMLAGQHYTVWSDLYGRFVDLSRSWTEDEKRWRQRPAVNHLLYWFMLLHARLTENPPVCTYQPSTQDRLDALMAESLDTIVKTVGREVAIEEVFDRLVTWLIPGGQAFLKTRVDLNAGDFREWIGPALLSGVGGDGSPIERLVPAVPYDKDGNPLAMLTPDGMGYTLTGDPHREREGGLVVDVLSTLEARGQWGASIPWHRKAWHIHRSFLTPEEVWEQFEVECEPDTFGDQSESGNELKRLLFGDGFFGAAGANHFSGHTTGKTDGYVEVFEFWGRPGRLQGTEQDEGRPGGRLAVVTNAKVLRDGQRPAPFPYTSPIRCFQFVTLPGRPSGTSPQEMLNPIQRAYNRGYAQFLEHRNLCTNPIGIVDNGSGIQDGQLTNRPGALISAARRPSVPALEFVAPPPLGADSYRIQEMLAREIRFLGNIDGSEGAPPTQDASGELVKELRFNSDRFVGPTAKRMVVEFARMIEDWIAILPTIWTEEKVITYAGNDNMSRTISVLPEMWGGKVHVFPDVESMLPEGRGERQARVRQMWVDGAFGPPDTPQAVRQYLELSRFPHLGRAARPGGVHRSTAEQENGKLLQGIPAEQIPVFPWYDDLVHLEVHEEFMASPEFLALAPEIQAAFEMHRAEHEGQMMAKMVKQIAQEEALQPATPDAGGNGKPAGGGPSKKPPGKPGPAK